jgi:hypothetical protein
VRIETKRSVIVGGDPRGTSDIEVTRSEDGTMLVLGQFTPQTGNLNAVVLTPQQAGDLISALIEITLN